MQVLCSLVFYVPLGQFASALGNAEFQGKGVSFSNLNEPANFSAALALVMQVVDLVLLIFVLWYLTNVRSGE